MEELPICRSCNWCAWYRKKGRKKYELECYKNRNLGAVGINYDHCPSYQKMGRK